MFAAPVRDPHPHPLREMTDHAAAPLMRRLWWWRRWLRLFRRCSTLHPALRPATTRPRGSVVLASASSPGCHTNLCGPHGEDRQTGQSRPL